MYVTTKITGECEGAYPWDSWEQNWNCGVSTVKNVKHRHPPACFPRSSVRLTETLDPVQNERRKRVVILTWGAAGAPPLSVYDEPEDQSQDGAQRGQNHKDPQRWAEWYPLINLGDASRGSQLDLCHLWGEETNELPPKYEWGNYKPGRLYESVHASNNKGKNIYLNAY